MNTCRTFEGRIFGAWLAAMAFALLPTDSRSSESVPGFVEAFLEETGLRRNVAFSTGFERVDEFKNFYIVPQNHKESSSHDLSSEQRMEGKYSHKAWMHRKNERIKNVNTNHRAYPTIQMDKTARGIVRTTVLVELSVWADIDLFSDEDRNWFSLATFTSYNDTEWFRSYLVNVDKDYRVHLMHVPKQGESKPDIFSGASVSLPRRKWSRISTFIDYTRQNRFNSPIIAVWQDGVLVAASRFDNRIDPFSIPSGRYPKCLDGWNRRDVGEAEKRCGLKFEGGLAQMHFGLYAPPLLATGLIYNDALMVSEIVRGKRNELQHKTVGKE